jgi:3',5'-cyclic-AMP phosphodiesterase
MAASRPGRYRRPTRNHDDRAAFRDRFPGTPCDDHGFIQSTLSLDGHTLVFLDTKGDRDHSGAYCGQRLAWLDNVLRTKRGPILLFMHHPPFMVGISSIDAIGLADREAFAECVRPHAHRIRHLFLGHVHRPIAGSWLGIPFSVVKGTNHQVALRLDDHGHEIPGSHEPPAYAVALVSDERVVVHTCDFGDRSPRFPLDAHEAGGRAYALDMQFA